MSNRWTQSIGVVVGSGKPLVHLYNNRAYYKTSQRPLWYRLLELDVIFMTLDKVQREDELSPIEFEAFFIKPPAYFRFIGHKHQPYQLRLAQRFEPEKLEQVYVLNGLREKILLPGPTLDAPTTMAELITQMLNEVAETRTAVRNLMIRPAEGDIFTGIGDEEDIKRTIEELVRYDRSQLGFFGGTTEGEPK